MTLEIYNNIYDFIDELTQLNNNVKTIDNVPQNDALQDIQNTQDIQNVQNVQDTNQINSTLESTSFIIDSFIFDKLLLYFENAINHNDLSFLTSLLLCKLIKSKIEININNQLPFSKNSNLISAYLSIYTKIINPESSINLLSADMMISSNLIDLINNEPNTILSSISSRYIEQAKLYFDNIGSEFEQITDKSYSSLDFHMKFEAIKQSNTEMHDLFKLRHENRSNKLITKIFGENKQYVSFDDSKNVIPDILLILIIKAIKDNRNNNFIQFLVCIYLYNYPTQKSLDKGLCYVLSMVFCRNALSRFYHTPITNMKELRQLYYNQFDEIIQHNSLIELNKFTNDNYIEYIDNRLKPNNPFYQVIFNNYDIEMTDFREGYDDYDKAMLYVLKRERALYNFLREQFKNRESEIRPKYNECCNMFGVSGIETPFKLNNNLFNQFNDKLWKFFDIFPKPDDKQKLISKTKDININDYEHYDNVVDYNDTLLIRSRCILHVELTDLISHINSRIVNEKAKTQPFKFKTYDGFNSMYRILSQFILILDNPKLHSCSNILKGLCVYYKHNKYVKLQYGNKTILISAWFMLAFQEFIRKEINNSQTKNVTKTKNVIIKLCSDLIASHIAEELIKQDNYKHNLAVILLLYNDVAGHAMCQIIDKNDSFIYDPNLKFYSLADMRMFNKLNEFSFTYYSKELLAKKDLFIETYYDDPDPEKYMQMIRKESYFRQNYPRLVRFLGGNRDELIKLVLWFLIVVVIVIVIVVIVRCVRRNKCRCNSNV